MNIADRLRAEVNELVSRESLTTDESYRRLMVTYSFREQHPMRFPDPELKVEEAMFGVAAYILGVHYDAQDKIELAERWLRIAAQHDVGDACLRMARLCERQSVESFNGMADVHKVLGIDLSGPVEDPKLGEARYWYQRAEEAGYTNGSETPPKEFDLDDCCQPVSEAQSRDRAFQIISEAKEKADSMLRRARADVQVIVDEGRMEIRALALQQKSITEKLGHVRAVLHSLAGLVGQPRRSESRPKKWLHTLSRRKSHDPTPPVAQDLEQDLAYCTQAIMGLPMPPETIDRPMLTAMLMEVASQPKPADAEVLLGDRPIVSYMADVRAMRLRAA